MLLQNKKALVTGSSRGIGRAIVEAYLKNGAEVWGLCSKPSAAKADLEKLAAENGVAFHEIYADVGNAEQVTEVVKAALAEAGGFDVLVNNAGITRDGLSFRMKQADWDDVIRINLTSVFLISQIVSSSMIRAKDKSCSIINMASIVGLHGQGGQVNYVILVTNFTVLARSYTVPVRCLATGDSVDVPVIASGGAGEKKHFLEAFEEAHAEAVLAASLFHYKELSISEVKEYLRDKGVNVRCPG